MALVGITPEGRRLLEACEMHELGLDIMRARFRREQPHATTAEIEAMVRAWISDRPYDSPGRPAIARARDLAARVAALDPEHT